MAACNQSARARQRLRSLPSNTHTQGSSGLSGLQDIWAKELTGGFEWGLSRVTARGSAQRHPEVSATRPAGQRSPFAAAHAAKSPYLCNLDEAVGLDDMSFGRLPKLRTLASLKPVANACLHARRVICVAV